MRTFTNDGLTFDVLDRGEGADAVVLLHGFPQTSASWEEVMPSLVGAGLRVLAPDQRGYSPGARPRPRSEYRMSALVGDVLALADAADLRRFHVVGHDWGAAVAWALASGYPDRVRTLTALSVGHPRAFTRSMLSSSQLLKSWYMLAFQPPRLPEWIAARRNGALLARALGQSGLPEPHLGRTLDHLRQPGALTGGLNWYRGVPFDRQAPGKVSVPTTFAWSTADIALGRRGAELTARWVTGAYRFEVLPGVSHWLPEEAPDRVAELILDRVATTV